MTATPTLSRAGGRGCGTPTGARCAGGSPAGLRPRRVFSGVFALFGWAVGISSLSDNSFFWHLRTGEYILDHGIPHHDVFSFTAPGTHVDRAVVARRAHVRVLYRSFGAFGVRFFVGLVGAGIGLLAYRLALRLARDRVRGLRDHARRTRRDLHALVGAPAPDRRALLPGPALDRRGARQLRRSPSAHRAAGAVLAVGERARQLRARLRLPGAAPARALGRRPPAVGRARTAAARRRGDRLRRDVRRTRTASSS